MGILGCVFFHVDGFGFVAVGGGFSAVFVWICALNWVKFCCSSGGNKLCFLTIRLGLIGDSGKRKNGWLMTENLSRRNL